MTELESIEVDPEDVATFEVGEVVFGREIMRIDPDRCLLWVRPPGRWYLFRRWLRVLWWRVTSALPK